MPIACRWLLSMFVAVILLSPPVAEAMWVEAGPIWSNSDAQQKCPSVCGGAKKWDGNWKTTQPGRMSVCSCTGKHQQQSGGSGASCSAPATKACAGCSVSCPAGQGAYCTGGEDTQGGGICWTRPSCTCR